MRVTHYTTLDTSVTKLVPWLWLHHPVLKFRQCTVVMQQLVSYCEIFQDHLTLKLKGKLVCQWRQVSQNCSYTVTANSKLECFKRFFNYCNKKQPSCHFWYVTPLKPSKLTDRFIYVFFDTGCTQDQEKNDGSFEYNPNLICAQQMFPNMKPWIIWVSIVNSVVNIPACFGQDTIAKFISYPRLSKTFADNIYII